MLMKILTYSFLQPIQADARPGKQRVSNYCHICNFKIISCPLICLFFGLLSKEKKYSKMTTVCAPLILSTINPIFSFNHFFCFQCQSTRHKFESNEVRLIMNLKHLVKQSSYIDFNFKIDATSNKVRLPFLFRLWQTFRFL